uniref:BMA-PDFR-1, isoform e n=1 Tax=Brugia malayi TaxID=6279 RepID=A0A1I9G275_BRUMA|nr:BMA-PDFR-1, isoform e [Brugia malayi]
MQPSTSWAYNAGKLVQINGLEYNRARTMDECIKALERSSLPTFPDSNDGSLWCNATFDTVLCWPATPANSSITVRCPPLKGLDPGKNITKWCHSSGRWMGRAEGDFSRPHGWTNFTMCFTREVVEMMTKLTNGSLVIAQEVARNARKLEFVGLGLSLISLLISIAIFSYFRRLRVFRNLLHLQLMIAILMVVIIRLILYIDLIFTDRLGPHNLDSNDGKTINTMVFLCETMFFMLEYFKTVAFCWMFLEGFYLHNKLVFTVFASEVRLRRYLITGYDLTGFPLVQTFLWLAVILMKKQGKMDRCLGSYYLEPEFWLLDGPRMFELVINLFFICNVIRVLWTKVSQSHNTSELDRMKKSVKAALMLIPLLGIPNIMQTIPFSPTKDNIVVRNVLKTHYGRLKLQHTSTINLRHGSRSNVLRNGTSSGAWLNKSENDKLLRIQKCSIKNGAEGHNPTGSALISMTQSEMYLNLDENDGSISNREALPNIKQTKKRKDGKRQSLMFQCSESITGAYIPIENDNSKAIRIND